MAPRDMSAAESSAAPAAGGRGGDGICCGMCGASAGSGGGAQLLFCAACRGAAYCGPACQRAHWKAGHKQACRATVAAQQAAAAAAAEPEPELESEGLVCVECRVQKSLADYSNKARRRKWGKLHRARRALPEPRRGDRGLHHRPRRGGGGRRPRADGGDDRGPRPA